MKYLMRFLRSLVWLVLLVLAIPLSALLVLQVPVGQTFVSGIISSLASSDDRTVTLERLSIGLGLSEIRIGKIELSDEDGLWFEAESLALDWQPLEVFSGAISITRIGGDRILLARLPKAGAPEEPAPEDEPASLPSLPPFKISIGKIAIEEISLGETVIGTDIALALDGSAQLVPDPLLLTGTLGVTRIDGVDGTISASVEFVPSAEQLSFNLDVDEPRGGLVANLLDVSGLPALTATLAGSGPLTDWAASLSLALDGRPTVSGTAQLTSSSETRQLAFDLDGQLDPLMPPVATALFMGTTNAKGTARFSPEFQPLALQIAMTTGTVNLNVDATTAPDLSQFDGEIDLDLSAGDGALIALDIGDRRIAFGPTRLNSTLSGSRSAADWSVALNAASVQTTEGRFDAADLVLTGSGANLSADALSSPFSATLDVFGVSAKEPELALLDGRIGLELAGRAAATPLSAEISSGQLTTSIATLLLESAAYTLQDAQASGTLQIADLSRFADLAGVPFTGSTATTFTVSGDPQDLDLTADLSTTVRNFSSGIAAADGLLGSEPRLVLAASADNATSFGLENLTLTGAGLEVTASGRLEEDRLQSKLAAQLHDLSRLDQQLSGSTALNASAEGPLGDLTVDVEASSPEILLAGTALKNLEVALNAQTERTAPQGRFEVTAQLGDLPLSVTADVKSSDGGTTIEPLEAALGTNRIDGGFKISETSRALETLSGKVQIEAPDLAELSPLLLTEIAGRVSGEIRASETSDGTAIDVDLTGSELAGPGFDLATTTARVSLPAPFDPTALRADVIANDISAGGTVIRQVTVSAKPGNRATALDADIRLSTGEQPDGLSFAGELATVEGGYELALSRLDGRYDRLTTRLSAPATIAYRQGIAQISDFTLALGDGRMSLSGQAGETLDLTAKLARVPLSLANAVQPGLGLGGTLSGEIKASGSSSDPAADWSINGAGLTAAALSDNGIARLDLASTGTLSSNRIQQETRVSGPEGMALTARGAVGLASPQALDIQLDGSVPLALARKQIIQAGLRATGAVNIDGRVGGTIAAPRYNIEARPSGVSVTGLSTGFTVRNVTGSVSANQDTVSINNLNAEIATGGTLSASGTVGLADGMPADISARISQGRYIQAGLVSALVNADLGVSGPLASPSQSALVSGTVTINKADISVPENLVGAVSPVAVQHVNAPAAVRRQVAELGGDKPSTPSSGSGTQPPRLDVTLSAPGRIFVRGRGLDAELQGNLRIVGTTAEPQAIGSFTLRRGQFNILTRRLQFSSGSATFNGSLTPDIEFIATTTVRSTQITITVAGAADDPAISFTSSPELPQDEVLALLLFGKEMGNLSPAQIAQLAGSLATLTGGSDNGPLAALRRSLGLDVVDVNTDGDDGPSLAVGKYINDNIYLGVEQGAGSESSRVQVDIELDRGLKLRGEVGADGSSKAGIFFEREY